MDTGNTPSFSLERNFVDSILANSKASLRAIGIHLSAAPLFKEFPNIATLHLYNSSLSPQELYDAVHQFSHLSTLIYDSSLPETTTDSVVTVLQLPLPPNLRRLSIEPLIWRPSPIVHALPDNTTLELLNFRRLVVLDGELDRSALKSLCRGKGIRWTFGELWNLWDNLCTLVPFASIVESSSVDSSASQQEKNVKEGAGRSLRMDRSKSLEWTRSQETKRTLALRVSKLFFEKLSPCSDQSQLERFDARFSHHRQILDKVRGRLVFCVRSSLPCRSCLNCMELFALSLAGATTEAQLVLPFA